MSSSRPGSSRYESLQASRRALAWTAPVVRWGLYSAGVTVFLSQVRPLLADGQFTWGERRVMGVVALMTVGGFGLAGWVGGRLVRAAADLCEVVIDGAEAAVQASYLLETQVAPALVRAANALERLAETPLPAARPQPSPSGGTTGSPAELVRQAMSQGRWGRAEHLLRGLPPGDPQTTLLAAELARAKQAEADRLHDQLETARERGDVTAVIDGRDALTTHLRGAALDDLDRRLVRWLYDTLRARVRSGSIDEETVAQVARVADTFGETPETQQLLRALPELYRQLGLCPACGGRHEASAACPRARASRAAPGENR